MEFVEVKNVNIIDEMPNAQAFKLLNQEPIIHYYLIGDVCNIGKEDLEGAGLIANIGLYKQNKLLDTFQVIVNPSQTLVKAGACDYFKWGPIGKNYNYDRWEAGKPYFINGLCNKDNVLCDEGNR